MHDAHAFIEVLAIVMCVAAVTTVLFQRLHQPVVLGYILAGLIVGPYVPIPIVANREIVQTLSEVGVILLMFSLGLEFSLRKLLKVGPRAGLTALVQCSILLWLGFVTGRAFGWTVRESVFAGAIIAISSTTIIAKAFDEQRITGKLRELVVGVLIVEDLIAILLMAALTAMTASEGLSVAVVAWSIGRLALFLVGLLVVGLLIVPRGMRAITRLQRPETTLVASIGVCFASALLALKFGYSVALGAFLAGSLVAESGEEKQVEHLVEPIRDMFAAVFFVSVGMSIDPATLVAHWLAVVVFTCVVIAGKVLGVTLGAFLTGAGTRLSVQAGMSLAQIGEFSFIIAGLGTSLGATGHFLYPIAVAVSAITTLSTPWLIRISGRCASAIDAALPSSLQTFAALYASWLERLGTTSLSDETEAATRRSARLLAIDVALLAALVISAALYAERAARALEQTLKVSLPVAHALLMAIVVAFALPLCIGIFNLMRHLGVTLAEAALPRSAEGKSDLIASARRALLVTLQLAVLLLVGLPLLAVTQPFVRGPEGGAILLVLFLAFGFVAFRRANSLQGQVRAGTELIALAFSSPPTQKGRDVHDRGRAQLERFLADVGQAVEVELTQRSSAVGQTLASLDLRGLTGATVLAITRTDQGVIIPTAQEKLRSNDVLVLAGSHAAVADARRLLDGAATAPSTG
jgi:CPA2 family monovalent cation:H+ antiporter-2